MQQQRKRKINLSSAIGWVIFFLVIGGGPLIGWLWRTVSGTPAPPNLVPYLLGGLVALSIVVSVVRSIVQASARRGDTALPTGMPPRSNAPMPPFGGPNARSRLPSVPQLPSASPPGQPSLGTPRSARIPEAPRFEPVLNPLVMIIAAIGLVLLGVVAVLLRLGQSLP